MLLLWETPRLNREAGRSVALVGEAKPNGYLVHVTSLYLTFTPRNYGAWLGLEWGINDAEKEARLLPTVRCMLRTPKVVRGVLTTRFPMVAGACTG
ncbi:hypothetical protein ACWDO7_26620 [Streptomyces sp. NPDC003656]